MTEVDNGLFAHNKATFAGGAIYADSASTTQLASEYNHTLAQSANLVACFIQFGNEFSPVPVHIYIYAWGLILRLQTSQVLSALLSCNIHTHWHRVRPDSFSVVTLQSQKAGISMLLA